MESNNSYSDEYSEDASTDYGCYAFRKGIQPFVRYYMPSIVIIGLLGNSLSALTFMATKLRKIPSSHYLAALAFADSGMLLCHVMLMSGDYPSIPGLCQLTFYSGGVFSFLSVWYVVSFTLERFIAVRYPLQRLRWCNVGRARLTVCGVAAFACLFNSHLLVSVHATINPMNETECNVREGFIGAASMMNHIDTALTFVIPLILIVVWNAAIAATTICWKSRQEAIAAASSRKGRRKASIFFRGTADEGMAVGILLPATAADTFLGGEPRRHVKRRLADDRKITRMLLIVSLIFLLMNFPDYVIRMVIFGLFRTDTWHTLPSSDRCWIETAQKITTIVFNTNFATNFFLYSLVGANFRNHLKLLVCRTICCIFEKLDDILPSALKLRRSGVATRIYSRLLGVDLGRSRLSSTSNGYGAAAIPHRSSAGLMSNYCIAVSPASIRHSAHVNGALSPSPSWRRRKDSSFRLTTAADLALRQGSISRDLEKGNRLRLNSSDHLLSPASAKVSAKSSIAMPQPEH